MTANDRKRRLQKAVTEFALDGGWRAEAPGARLGRLIVPHARSNCTLPSACRPTINSPTTGSLCHPAARLFNPRGRRVALPGLPPVAE